MHTYGTIVHGLQSVQPPTDRYNMSYITPLHLRTKHVPSFRPSYGTSALTVTVGLQSVSRNLLVCE